MPNTLTNILHHVFVILLIILLAILYFDWLKILAQINSRLNCRRVCLTFLLFFRL